MGLACGGRVQIFVEESSHRISLLLEHLLAASGANAPTALVTNLATGAQALVNADGHEGELALEIDELAQVHAARCDEDESRTHW